MRNLVFFLMILFFPAVCCAEYQAPSTDMIARRILRFFAGHSNDYSNIQVSRTETVLRILTDCTSEQVNITMAGGKPGGSAVSYVPIKKGFFCTIERKTVEPKYLSYRKVLPPNQNAAFKRLHWNIPVDPEKNIAFSVIMRYAPSVSDRFMQDLVSYLLTPLPPGDPLKQ